VRSIELGYDPDRIGNHGAAVAIVTDVDTHRTAAALSGTGTDPSVEISIQGLRFSDDDVCIRFNSQRGYTYELL